MIQTICQWLLVAYILLGFFISTHSDFERSKGGFRAFMFTCLVTVAMSLMCYGAGAFDQIFGQ